MKKVLSIIIATSLAFWAFSCTKEQNVIVDESTHINEPVIDKEPFKLVADVDSEIDATTKTALSGRTITWGELDAVKAYGIYTYISTDISRTNENKTAEFTFPPIEDGDEVHYAIYPAAKAGGDDEDHMTVTIPATQTATKGSFDPEAMASIGRILDGNKISFKNVGALLSIVINNDDIASVEISATEESSQSLTGTADIIIDESDEITTLTDGSSMNVKLTGTFDKGGEYFFVVYPGEYSNLKLVFTNTDGEIATFRNTTPFAVGRNENWRIANFTVLNEKWDTPKTYFTKVDKSLSDWSGDYLFVYEPHSYAYDGSKTAADLGASGDYKTVTISDDKIESTSATQAIKFTVAKIGSTSNYSIKSASGYYIGRTANSNGINQSTSEVYNNTISYEDGTITITSSAGPALQFLDSKGSYTFKYYSSSQKKFSLFKYDESSSIDSDTYSVTYDANGGTGAVPTDATTYSSSVFTVSVQSATLTKTGFTFSGWNTEDDGSGTHYNAGDKFIITSDVTLYAEWTPIVYTITKNTNAHGTYTVKAGDVEVTEATYGTDLTLTAATPESGYTFSKFQIDYIKEDSTPAQSNFIVNPKAYKMPASNITITLVLSEVTMYDVTWKVGTTTYHSEKLAEGETLSLPSAPDPDAYGFTGNTFMGWTSASSVNSDGTSIVYAANGDDVTSDVVYHAVFAEGSLSPASLTKLGSSYSLTDDDELVIVAMSGTTEYGLLEETFGTSYVNNFVFDGDASSIASAPKKHWTVSTESTKKYLGDSTNGYLYTSSSNNLSAPTANKSEITLTWVAAQSKFSIKVGGSRYLCLRSDLSGDNKYKWRLNGTSIGENGVYYFDVYKYNPASGSMSNYKLEMP